MESYDSLKNWNPRHRKSLNILLFGQSAVGKSSLTNTIRTMGNERLLSNKTLAGVRPETNKHKDGTYTTQYTKYSIPNIAGFTLWDTCGWTQSSDKVLYSKELFEAILDGKIKEKTKLNERFPIEMLQGLTSNFELEIDCALFVISSTDSNPHETLKQMKFYYNILREKKKISNSCSY